MGVRSKRFERRLRWTLLGALAGGRPRVANGFAGGLAGARRVLLLRVNFRMGNLLLATPALAAVRRAMPGARIVLVTGRRYADLVRGPDVDRIVGVDRRSFWHPTALARLAATLRRERFDLVVDLARGSSFLGALCARLAGGRQRVCGTKGRYRRLFNVHLPSGPSDVHKVDVVLSYLAGLGVSPVTRQLGIHLEERERDGARARLARWGVRPGRALVGVHLGGRDRKRISPALVRSLVGQLSEVPSLDVLLLLGPEERDRSDAIGTTVSPRALVPPALAVRDLAAVLERCDVVVGMDSGPLHLAAAVGTPTIGLHAPGMSQFYRPLGQTHRTLRVPGTADAIVAAVQEMLSPTRQREAARSTDAGTSMQSL